MDTSSNDDLVSYWDDLQPISFARACSSALDAAWKRDATLVASFLTAAERLMGEENRVARARCEFVTVGITTRVFEKVSANCRSILQGKPPPFIWPLDGQL